VRLRRDPGFTHEDRPEGRTLVVTGAWTEPTLRSFELESCPGLDDLEALQALTELRELAIADCGPVPTLAPLTALTRLEALYACGGQPTGHAW
jgi:hypothetical protein